MLDSLIGAGASIVGGLFGDDDAEENRKMQREFAQKGIQWKVADAKKAGIHPLYALGAQTNSYNPVSSPMGQAIADAGQSISRGVSNSYEKQLQVKNLENIQADINLKNAQATGFIADAKRASDVARSGLAVAGANKENVGKYAGVDIKRNKNFMDAETGEARYGDITQEFIGISNLIADLKNTAMEAMAESRKNAYKPKTKRNYQRGRQW